MTRNIFLLLGLMLLTGQAAASPAAHTGSFIFESWDGPGIRVHTAGPSQMGPDTRIVFVLHGVGRNASEYRDNWTHLAEEHGLYVLVPEFSRADFPGADAYNLGGITAEQPLSKGAYGAIEAIFDEIRSTKGLGAQTYALFGHSAGAQFVHRFACFEAEARFDIAVSANAGWYMMPDGSQAWPYGTGGIEQGCSTPDWLARPLLVLLGEEDDDPDHSSLRRTPEASLQGDHRLARGMNFFAAARALAQQKGWPFNWQMATVEGAAHDNAAMAEAAITWIRKAEPR